MTIGCNLPATHARKNRPLSNLSTWALGRCEAALRALAPKARARTLDATDCAQTAFTALRSALKQAGPGDTLIQGRIYGGFVPNSYRYPAESDICWFWLDLDPTTGKPAKGARIRLEFSRARAQSRSHGKGEQVVTRIVREGQTDGRLVR
jgi:hypothetical protein